MRFFIEYTLWHYSKAVKEYIHIVFNFVWFFYTFFSIPILLKSFFAPFKRLKEDYGGGFNPQKWLEAFVITTLMRIVGMLMRSILIIFGVFFIILTVIVGLFFLVVWLLAPLFVCFLFVYGFKLVTIP
jgi:hypothetical protein